ncbi:ATP-binding protein, partial [Porticoccaceae bacterium]|nr:ATP-binding protein [Porticoccaceae bacterium]
IGEKGKYEKYISISGERSEIIQELISSTSIQDKEVEENSESDENVEAMDQAEEDGGEEVDEGDDIDLSVVTDGLNYISPIVTFFEHETGLLPSQIDIVINERGNYTLKGQGASAARNFLIVAELNLKCLVESDIRTRASLLSKANSNITKDFSTFWSQTIGRKDKLKLECEIQTYGAEAEEKSGEKYLLFWVSDGLNKLYPKQRSQGVRWFVSFYLQLKASEMLSTKRLFLLDEPGANLHSKAQTDVIKLINNLSKEMAIVYSTHIPHMLEYDKLYRVLAVQRMGEEDDSPTEIKPAHELGTASTDTLSPVLTAMGVDLANQEVIKKNCNVLLEEMSGFYYFKSFWELIKEKQEAHFIAATGVNKIPNFANMFLGWGLGYIVVVDDDKSGRNVYNSLKREIFSDDEDLAKKNMYKIKGCDGIEDIFSKKDFKSHIVEDNSATIDKTNSHYMKEKKLSKPVHAYKFLIKVRNGDVSFGDLDSSTQGKINDLVSEVVSRLSAGIKNQKVADAD